MKKNKLLLFLLISISSLLLSMDNKNTGRVLSLSSERQADSWLTELPDEIIEKILSYEGINIPELSRTNKRLRCLAKTHLATLWKNLKTENKLFSKIARSIESPDNTHITFRQFCFVYITLLKLSRNNTPINKITGTTNPTVLLEISQTLQKKMVKIWPQLLSSLKQAGINPITIDPSGSRQQVINTEQIKKWLHDQHNQSAMQRVTNLYLHDLDLKALPKEISLLAGLQKLGIHGTLPLIEVNIPETLTALESLALSLCQSKQVNIPDTLSALQNLNLRCNILKEISIPDAFTALQNLELSSNKLTEVSIPITLTALKELDLSHNQLTEVNIPPTLTALQNINTSYNRLTRMNIPSTLTALKILDLSSNELTEINIPNTLTALQDLNLMYNHLTKVNISPTLIALQRLCLSSNELTKIHIPTTLTALQQLFLYNNELKEVTIPNTLTALQTLNLHNNQLRKVRIPATVTALQRLDLYNNQLKELNIPNTLTALRDLNTSNNQLTEESITIPQTIRQIPGITIIGDDYLGLEDDLGLSCTIS